MRRMPASSTVMPHTPREESFPLLRVEHTDVDGTTLSGGVDESSYPANYCRGASAMMGKWPGHASAPWRIVGGVIALIIGVVVIVLVMFSLSSVLVPSAFPVPRDLVSKRSVDSCDYFGDPGAADSAERVWQNLIPLETQRRFAADDNRAFFVKLASDRLSTIAICALRSSVLVNNRSTYLIVVVDPDTLTINEEAAISSELTNARLDEHVSVMYVDPARFFDDTPMRGFYEKCGQTELQLLAVRVAILWRFGGASLSLDLLTLASGVGLPRDSNASTTVDGVFLGVRQPCHAFLFALMKALLVTRAEERPTVTTVMRSALASFCEGDYEVCAGVRILSSDWLCTSDALPAAPSDATKCHWATMEKDDVEKRFMDDFCPVPTLTT